VKRANTDVRCGPIAPGLSHDCGARARPARWRVVARISQAHRRWPIEITLTLLVPYVAYLAAGAIHASGVLAVVACGLYLSRQSSQFYLAKRAHAGLGGVGCADTIVLNGLGLRADRVAIARSLLAGNSRLQLWQLVKYGRAFQRHRDCARLIWMFPGAYLANCDTPALLHQDVRMRQAGKSFVVGWHRDARRVALAAAIALPEVLVDGSPFSAAQSNRFLTFTCNLGDPGAAGLTLLP